MAHSLPPFSLQGDDILEVYTHKSVRNEHSNGEKLAFLGERLLNFMIARHWYENLPDISPQELQAKTEQTLSDDLLWACIDKYELQRNIPLPAEYPDIGPDDARDFLNIYVGALYTQASISGVQHWVSTLIDPNGSPPHSPLHGNAAQPSLMAPMPPDPAPPLPPAPGSAGTPTPSLPPYSSPPGSSTSINASSSLVTLSRFNEYVTQRLNQVVTWESSHSGEAHRLLWTMTVLREYEPLSIGTLFLRRLVDGQPKGIGHGHSQKIAKEQAIRDAWTNLGRDGSAPSGNGVNSPQPQLLPPLSPLSSSVSLQSSSLNAFAASLNSDDSSALSSVTVAGFNEVAAKQHLQVTWNHNSTGDPHMPTWHTTCSINGEHMGDGAGRNKRESMLAAVHNTWRNMGWP